VIITSNIGTFTEPLQFGAYDSAGRTSATGRTATAGLHQLRRLRDAVRLSCPDSDVSRPALGGSTIEGLGQSSGP